MAEFNSFVSTLDASIRSLLYSRFGSILGIDTTSSVDADNINEGVIQFPKDLALRKIAEKRGLDRLQFISFWKTGFGPDWERQRTPAARRGLYLATSEDENDTVHVKAYAAKINYDVCFWSNSLDKINELLEQYIIWQQDDPNLKIKYDDLYDFEPDLHFGDIIDESPIVDILNRGKLFIYKVPITLDAWVLSGFSMKTIKKIVLTVYDEDDLSDDEIDTIIVNDSSVDEELESALRFFTKEFE